MASRRRSLQIFPHAMKTILSAIPLLLALTAAGAGVVAPGAKLEKLVFMVHGENTVAVAYRLLAAPPGSAVLLSASPWLTGRTPSVVCASIARRL